MRFRPPEDDASAMLDELFEDLRVDGFRSLRFSLQAAKQRDDDFELEEAEVDFRKEQDDKWDAHDRIMATMGGAYAGPALKGEMVWIEDDTFEKLKAGKMWPSLPACFAPSPRIPSMRGSSRPRSCMFTGSRMKRG